MRTVSRAEVQRDAACKCARHVAEKLAGLSVDEVEERAGLFHRHFPSLASMVKLNDYNHDTLMHESGRLLPDNLAEQLKPFVQKKTSPREREAKEVLMARYRVTYWKEIPTSFAVEGDGRTVKKQLSQKIQNLIDAYAMSLGLTSTEAYSAQYRRGEWMEREGSPEEVAEALLAELEAEFGKFQIPKRNKS